MRSYCIGIALIILIFSLMACSTGGGKDFSGTWESAEWGVLVMEQNGSSVTGAYEYPTTAGQMYGQLEGQVEGNQLNLKWHQSTERGLSYEETPQRGDAYLILADNGNSIAGQWRMENQEEWGGDWDFVRK